MELKIKELISPEDANLVFELAKALCEGRIFEEDEKTAMELFLKAANAGDIRGYAMIGEMLEDNDPDKAIIYYKRGAGKGDTNAMVLLGCMLEERGLADDARYCFNMACDGDSVEGMYRYALLCDDEDEKLKWLKKSSEKGYFYAPAKIGEIYERKENETLALFFYRQGLERGDETLREKVDILEEKMSGEIDVDIEYDDEDTM